jgi:hypothetical protein
MYTAIVLTEASKKELRDKIDDFVPLNWIEVMDHHTINLGPVLEEHKPFLGKKFTLILKDIGFSTKAVAVSVVCDEIKSQNKIPHITLATNPVVGGKPKDSNDIEDWLSLKPFFPANEFLTVEGILTEVQHG